MEPERDIQGVSGVREPLIRHWRPPESLTATFWGVSVTTHWKSAPVTKRRPQKQSLSGLPPPRAPGRGPPAGTIYNNMVYPTLPGCVTPCQRAAGSASTRLQSPSTSTRMNLSLTRASTCSTAPSPQRTVRLSLTKASTCSTAQAVTHKG